MYTCINNCTYFNYLYICKNQSNFSYICMNTNFVNFSKMVIDTSLKISGFTTLLTGYPTTYHLYL